MHYGKAIRTCRVAFGLRQKEVAEKAGITPSFLSLIEAEHRKPSMNNVERISDALGVPVHLLLLLASDSDELLERPPGEIEQLAKSLLQILVAGHKEKIS